MVMEQDEITALCARYEGVEALDGKKATGNESPSQVLSRSSQHQMEVKQRQKEPESLDPVRGIVTVQEG